ncbi:MAG: hypothetical protein E6713_10190 [Sporomusaceae bacterium]|nr:hypothetical protein [Sporomusaceae bacterium]
MRRKIRFLLILFSLTLFVSQPSVVQAAENGFKVNFSFVRQNDGTTLGEVWYNDQIFWRLVCLSDGVKTAVGQAESHTTYIVPDINKGFFYLTLYSP